MLMFKYVMRSVDVGTNPHKAMNKVMMKILGERDFSAQETMHLLLSLKLYSTAFNVLPTNLNGSRKVQTHVKDQTLCMSESMLDTYANHILFKPCVPHIHIMDLNFVQFATKISWSKDQCPSTVVPRVLPTYIVFLKSKRKQLL